MVTSRILCDFDRNRHVPRETSARLSPRCSECQAIPRRITGTSSNPSPYLNQVRGSSFFNSNPKFNGLANIQKRNISHRASDIESKCRRLCLYPFLWSRHQRGVPQSQFSNYITGDLALVLLGRTPENNVRYLLGPTLAITLKAMVDKGLVVSLVLDCCFSASVFRQKDPAVRFLPFDASIDDEIVTELTIDPGDGSTQPAGSAARDVSMLPNWLIVEKSCLVSQMHGGNLFFSVNLYF